MYVLQGEMYVLQGAVYVLQGEMYVLQGAVYVLQGGFVRFARFLRQYMNKYVVFVVAIRVTYLQVIE